MSRNKLSFFVIVAVPLFAASVFGQQTRENQTTADENFKVSITDKKVVETNYESKVELKLNSETRPAVSVNIGAAVRAEQITLTLKNIFGDVRFRGSLEKISNRLNLTRPPKEQQ